MELDDILDQAVMIMALALFLLVMMPHTIKMYHTDYGGFGTRIEKTALKTDKSLTPLTMEFCREDIILMISVTDEYEPAPCRINIDGYIIDVNDTFLQNKIPTLIAVNNKLANDGTKYSLSVVPGDTQAKEWKFTKIS